MHPHTPWNTTSSKNADACAAVAKKASSRRPSRSAAQPRSTTHALHAAGSRWCSVMDATGNCAAAQAGRQAGSMKLAVTLKSWGRSQPPGVKKGMEGARRVHQPQLAVT